MKIISIGLITLLLASGCARDINPSNVSAGAAGEAMTTYRGVIVSLRKITVESGDSFDNNGIGLLFGGATGAVLGSTIGKGSGNALATIGGAAAGAALGALAEGEIKEQDGLEYVVRRDDGQLITVVQGLDQIYSNGTRVYVQISNRGRSRIIPAN